jgi:fructokinase
VINLSQQSMQSANILIFGEVLADLFPEQTIIGGAPYNVARHLQAFGLQPLLVTKVGMDAYGDAIEKEMQANNMDCRGLQRDAHYPTGQVKVTFTAQGHQFEIMPNQAYDVMDARPVLNLMTMAPPEMLYIGTLALREMTTRRVAQALLEQITCLVFCDINLRAPWFSAEVIALVLNHAHTLKINHEELAVIAQMLGIHGSPEAQAKALQKQYHLTNILVTCGEQGSWWLTSAHAVLSVEKVQLAKPFVDSVGAGDAYSAVVIMGLLQGWAPQMILQRASAFAAAICGVRGAVPTDKKSIRYF